jgi:hypothetical protein
LAAVVTFAIWPESVPALPDERGATIRATRSADDAGPSTREAFGEPASSTPSASPDPMSADRAATRSAAEAEPRVPLQPELHIPGGKLDAAQIAKSEPLDKLLDAFRVRCTFGAGAGGQWPAGKIFPHTAAWQGGPIDFDTIDLTGSTARLIANTGVTGSVEGVLDVRVTPTATGLHFAAFNPRGDLILTSVYAARDASGAHRAVLTMNGPGLDNESAQFYGSCTL